MRRPGVPSVARLLLAVVGCLAFAGAGCTSNDQPPSGAAVRACQDEVPAPEREGLRTTVADDGTAQWFVQMWGDTPTDAPRPVGSPNWTCIAHLRSGEVVVDSFALRRQTRDISAPRLCEQLLPALAAVSESLSSRQDPGPDLVALKSTLPKPLPTGPAGLAQALRLLTAETGPAANAYIANEAVGINSNDFSDWPGQEARVRRACETT